MSCATGRARASECAGDREMASRPPRAASTVNGSARRASGHAPRDLQVARPHSQHGGMPAARERVIESLNDEMPQFFRFPLRSAPPSAPPSGGTGTREQTSVSAPGEMTRYDFEPPVKPGIYMWEGPDPGGVDSSSEDWPSCYPQDDVAVWASEVESLRSRCTLDLGEMFLDPGAVTLRAQLPSGYQPTTLKQDMLKEFVPEYMSANRIDWSTIADNVVANDQPEVMGCYWSGKGGVLHFAVLHALQMIAAGSLSNSIGLGAVDRFVAACSLIRKGELEIILSAGGTPDRSVLFATSDGRVACEWVGGDDDAPWTALTFTAIELAPVLVGGAAFADYLLWWAWRLHSYWVETGKYNGNVYYTGLAAARLAYAEIAKIGSLILHECGHLPFLAGSQGAHCTDVWDKGLDCPQDVMEPMWLGRAAVLYNLPAPHTPESTLDSVLDATAREMASGGNPASEIYVWAGITTVDLQLLFGNVWVERDGTRHVTGVSHVVSSTSGSHGAAEAHGVDGCPAGKFDVQITWRPTGTTAEVFLEIPEPCSSTGALRTISGMM